MSATRSTSEFPIRAVENFGKWFSVFTTFPNPRYGASVISLKMMVVVHAEDKDDHVAIVRRFYEWRIGQVASHWDGSSEPLDFKYANIKFAELFAFYTTPDGVLPWCHLKFALDEFLQDHPRYQYHPSRVQQLIDANGIERLTLME